MIIGFTGHRDKRAPLEALKRIDEEYPMAVWLHGGAREGFDRQVNEHDRGFLECDVIEPLYTFPHPGFKRLETEYLWKKIAPLERNKAIVQASDFTVALWDGRETGGTYFTIMYALKNKKRVEFINAGMPKPIEWHVGKALTFVVTGKWNDQGVPEPTRERFPILDVSDRLRNK